MAAPSAKKKIFFLCTGNAARSPMAEGLNAFYSDRYEARSAGVAPRSAAIAPCRR
jgi:protein-tyrosine-phosphatase